MIKISKILATLFLLLSCIVTTSCSSDNNEPEKPGPVQGSGSSGSYSITGPWRIDWGDDPLSDYTMYYFGSDGDGVYWDKGNGGERFKYTFDKASNTIISTWNGGNYTETYTVSKLSESSVKLNGETYRKTNLSYENIILGEWLLHVGPTNERSMTLVRFKYDGTYEARDNYTSSSLQSFTESGTYSIKKDIINITGTSDIAGTYIIDGLVINGCRLIQIEHPDSYPYIIGGWYNR